MLEGKSGVSNMENSIIKLELLQKHLYELENELLKPKTRQLSERIGELLPDDFIECCNSEEVYHYSDEDMFEGEGNTSQIKWQIKGFRIKQLSQECILATYKLRKHSELDETKRYSLRSSIWKLSNNTWKMVFHKGTFASKV